MGVTVEVEACDVTISKQWMSEAFREKWREAANEWDEVPQEPPKFEVTSAVQTAGSCRYGIREHSVSFDEIHVRKITVSQHIRNKAEAMDTIAHEIAHAVKHLRHGGNGHGMLWKTYARKLGADPTRTHDGPGEKICPEAYSDKMKYTIVCENCGPINGKTRKCKTVKQPELYECKDCNGRLTSRESRPEDVKKINH
jgi:predicted SprT family Zn-dependent metalloprotease